MHPLARLRQCPLEAPGERRSDLGAGDHSQQGTDLDGSADVEVEIGSGLEDARPGADHHPLGHVQMLALVTDRVGVQGAVARYGLDEAVQVRRRRDGHGRHAGQRVADHRRQRIPGPELHEQLLGVATTIQPTEAHDALLPADRAHQLGRQEQIPVRRRRVVAGVDVGDDRDFGVVEGDGRQDLPQPVTGRDHEGSVKGSAHRHRRYSAGS